MTVTDSAAQRAALLRDIVEGVSFLASRHRCSVARRVHRSGISLGHLQILWILQEHGPLPVSRLAEWLGIGVPNVTGLLDRMEQRGLVERVRDAVDRRVVLARQTDLGREIVREVDGWRSGVVEQVLEPLTTAQLAAIADHLRSPVLRVETRVELAHAPVVPPHVVAPEIVASEIAAPPTGVPAR